MAKKAAKKSAKKKSARKKPAKKRKKRFTDGPAFFVGIILLLMLILIIGIAFLVPEGGEEPSTVVVTVNGDDISRDQLELQYRLLPDAYKSQITQEEVLEQIVNEELVVQAAKAAGITVNEEEINSKVQDVIQSGGLSINDLQKNLEQFNITMDQFEHLIERQIYLTKYTSTEVQVPEPSEEDLQLLYQAREDEFSVPEQVTVQHILISNQREDSPIVGKELYDLARGGEDFCELVLENTDDKGSKDTCGEYTFPRGMMVPEFEEAAFDMSIGEYKLVQTVFGYHVMYKIAHHEPTVQPFEEVRDQVLAQYEGAEYARQYSILINTLREEATISYPGEAPAEPEVVEEPVALPDEESEEEPEEVEPDSEYLLECIVDSATLYGMSWSSDTQLARTLIPEIEYVECSENTDVCDAKGIAAYPTWIANDEIRMGVLSVDELAELTGCQS